MSKIHDWLRLNSLRLAIRQQGLLSLYKRLEEIVPDITNQYMGFTLDSEYYKTNVRGMHAFQVSLLDVEGAVVDIGGGPGTHLQYVKELYGLDGVVVDQNLEAIKRVKSKGIEAICARAEHLPIKGDTYLCFEVLEHLENPLGFLRSLKGRMIVTVPYVTRSRIRCNGTNPETSHMFEFSAEDWKRLFNYAGWEVKRDSIYLQYPRILSFLKYYWRWFDFEGFYGAVLEKGLTNS